MPGLRSNVTTCLPICLLPLDHKRLLLFLAATRLSVRTGKHAIESCRIQSTRKQFPSDHPRDIYNVYHRAEVTGPRPDP